MIKIKKLKVKKIKSVNDAKRSQHLLRVQQARYR